MGRGQIRMLGAIAGKGLDFEADRESLAELGQLRDKEREQNLANLQITVLRQGLAITQQVVRLEQTVRQEVLSRLELYNLYEALQQAAGNYRATLAGGLRQLEDRLRFRQQTAPRCRSSATRIWRSAFSATMPCKSIGPVRSGGHVRLSGGQGLRF